MGQSLSIPPIQVANASQPFQGPRLQLRPSLANTQKVAADMRRAEYQDQGAVLHLEHGFISAVAIHHEHAAGLGWVMIFWHLMATRVIQDVHHGIFAVEDPQPPTKAHLALLFHEDQPTRLIGLLIVRRAVALPQRRPRPPPQRPPTRPPPRN